MLTFGDPKEDPFEVPHRMPPDHDQFRDLQVLLRAHHPFIEIPTVEDERVSALLKYAANEMAMPFFEWDAVNGLERILPDRGRSPETSTAEGVLKFLARADLEAIVHMRGFGSFIEDNKIDVLLKALHSLYFEHRGTLVFSGVGLNWSPEIQPLVTSMPMRPLTTDAYKEYVVHVLRDVAKHRDVKVSLRGKDLQRFLSALHGLTLVEVRKIVTQAVVEDGRLDADDLPTVLEAKKRIIQRSGVLEYFPAEESLADIAGLDALKAWLKKRRAAFLDPARAKGFGLSAPRGLLLIGVQGCGKSLSAKAVATEWSLPLVRLDPSNLYQKYVGETEKNLQRAIKTAENMAPIVLWIDELEKALGQGDNDGGVSTRVFGTFLAWLQEKKEDVFVIATANDISKLPPELLRKGRFDEIFFIDLPNAMARESIFRFT
ncbi:MAG: AAA family ATPase [Polyangiales bacterium]